MRERVGVAVSVVVGVAATCEFAGDAVTNDSVSESCIAQKQAVSDQLRAAGVQVHTQ